MAWHNYNYPTAQAIPTKGGIKAQTSKGAFGKHWWAKRWIAVLESFDTGSRMSRGRSYARSGQVLSIDISPGQVVATVQGSRRTPYITTLHVKVLTREEWQRVITALSGQALFVAKLLSGEIPPEIEDIFTSAGLTLFPTRRDDLTTNCSCPDESTPCKHIAAVYYLLGEEFDRDPFLIFRLRGMDREELIRRLHETAGQEQPVGVGAEAGLQLPAEPLPVDPAAFWTGGTHPEELLGAVAIPSANAALLRRLGNFPFWRGAQSPQDALASMYEDAAQLGLEVAIGEDT